MHQLWVTLEVDASQHAAICPFCNSSYIVEQAINNYNVSANGNLNVENATISVGGIDINNFLLRAREFEAEGEYEMALDYYNQILDADISKQEARDGIERIKKAMNDYVYFETPATRSFTSGQEPVFRKLKIRWINFCKCDKLLLYKLRK